MINNNKLVLITGASGGVGSATAKHLAALGYEVGIGYCSNEHKAKTVQAEIENAGGKSITIKLDYQDRKQIRGAIDKLTRHFNKPVSILINNGAIAQEKPFDTITDDDWQQMMAINLQGPFIAAQEVLAPMRENHWGRIINITSIGGQWGGFNQVHYAASKAALINLTQSLAKIYSKDGVVTTAVAIGLVGTEMSANELQTDAGKEKVKNIPAQRLATVNEVAETIEFLCSDKSAYLTGQTLNVNGGMYFG